MDPQAGQPEEQGAPVHEIARASIPLSFDLTEFEEQKRQITQWAEELKGKLADAFDAERLLGPLESRLEALERRVESLAAPRPDASDAPQGEPEAPRREEPEPVASAVPQPTAPQADIQGLLPSQERFEAEVVQERMQESLDEIRDFTEEIRDLVQTLAGGEQ
jgi:hypothetical protein